MTAPPALALNDRNKSAWDRLYASTKELIWGREPVAFLPKLLPPATALPAGAVMDAAAGEGRNLALLLAFGRPVTACDSSPAALAKIPDGLKPRLTLLVCDLTQVPLPDGRFALILLSEAIETLPEPEPVLAELRRLLAPGGLLLANFPHKDDGVAGVGMRAEGEGWLYRNRYYYRFYGRGEGEELFAGAGLDLVAGQDFTWDEPPHPRFRSNPHRHHSRVLLGRRPC